MAYPPIEGHGLIGDLQTSALVAQDGTIDWFCAPRFDSPSLFGSLLDASRGGFCRLRPERDDFVTRQLYLPGTAILITRFMSPEGVGELLDFMPVTGEVAADRHSIVRIMRMVRGHGRFVFECEPAFDYARAPHDTSVTPHGVTFTSDGDSLTLNPARTDLMDRIEHSDRGVRVVVEAGAGDSGGMILSAGPAHTATKVGLEEIWRLYDETRDFWRSWVGRSTYRGRWRETVERSAITLKLMTYAPTGAPVAAPTAGLPELVGGARNWDYRYTWVRDASFSVHALVGLGYHDEAEAFMRWIRDRLLAGHERIMYRVDGSVDLPEFTLDHLDGYRGSRPVRAGNDANGQLQLDIFGEALDAVYRAHQSGLRPAYEGWAGLTEQVDWLCEHWDEPDDGIWESRAGRKDHTYGRVMSWVAFDRAIRLSQELGLPGNVPRWTAQRDAVYRQVMECGWDPAGQTFTQHYDTSVVDAALLYMPLVGFVSPRDPRWQSTLRAIDEHLVSDSLVYRYDPQKSPDGLDGAEGTFSMCTFWYVDALARSGRLDEARLTFEKMLTYSNHVGLYSEEIGPTGEQLGNFPQAFSHLALINAAIRLDEALA
ncbi:glycoside hydrolase family 15 protein [Dactylosporangium sp. NBC_01737]|uniref:glycoside hydrolase family 15 protein n=1 Tax=Dactylosporangium sp. NBC_01737 TaxID=2975959 RepID=UPI002E123C15|nr:glycoside hydrolase family 15 protein [Dactylosporangium sp. NBC_01737]